MCLQHITRIFFCLFGLLIFSNHTSAQTFQMERYDTEYSPYFKFRFFKRGEKSEIIRQELDKLEQIDKVNWTFDDSLKFAEISLKTGNTELAKYYTDHLSSHNPVNWSLLKLSVIICYTQKDIPRTKQLVDMHFKDARFQSEDYFLKKILLSIDPDENADQPILGIWNEKLTTLRKGSAAYKEKIISPITNARNALEFYVFYIHENDPRLANCFNELGLVLQNKVSLNQAYIAYSIARTYNKKDADILENVKRIKAKHIKRNYNTPNFRKYFPRIEYWRFDYEILKEKIISEKNDTIPKFTPNLVGPTNLIETPFPKDVIIPVGFIILIILILIFTKPERK